MAAPITRTFTTLNIDEINKTRVELGLKPIKYVKKPCMRCEKEFLSEGSHNRFCYTCRDKHKEGTWREMYL